MKNLLVLLLAVMLMTTVLFTGCAELESVISQEKSTTVTQETETTTPVSQPESTPDISSEPLIITILDVGQADCILVQQADDTMIIDAGNNADSGLVVDYIQDLGISQIDVVIGTHPHEDHIGGLDAVINNFDIGTIYMPKVSYTTKTYEDVLLAIQNKGLSITTPIPGTVFNLGNGVQCLILAPNSQNYEDTNSYSIVLKVTFNNKSFIFTGDAEADSEAEILDKGFDIDADVLKVGHHGSTSSTSDAFFQAVSPEYALISVASDNTYGHPHQKTLDKLNAAGVTIYRTDLDGTIIITVDGDQLSIDTEK